METLEQKYQALLGEAERRQQGDLDKIRLCFELLSLTSQINQDCAAQLERHGLSEGRFTLLFLLDAAPEGLAPGQLARLAGITPASVTSLLDGLERSGLIQRQADPADRRALKIHLTPEGKTCASPLFAQHSAWIAQWFEGLTLEESRQLSQLLGKIMQNRARTP